MLGGCNQCLRPLPFENSWICPCVPHRYRLGNPRPTILPRVMTSLATELYLRVFSYEPPAHAEMNGYNLCPCICLHLCDSLAHVEEFQVCWNLHTDLIDAVHTCSVAYFPLSLWESKFTGTAVFTVFNLIRKIDSHIWTLQESLRESILWFSLKVRPWTLLTYDSYFDYWQIPWIPPGETSNYLPSV